MRRDLKLALLGALAVAIILAAWAPAFATGTTPPSYCIDVVKYCSDAPDFSQPIEYWGEVTNCGSSWLKVKVTDLLTGQILYNMVGLAPGASLPFAGFYIPAFCGGPSTNSVEAIGYYLEKAPDGSQIVLSVSDIASATCQQPCDGGGEEGCTPGYWKNHLEDWGPTGYSPGDSFDAIFGVPFPGSGFATLLDAVNARGDSYNSLVRHAAAGLLNASSPYVDYPMTVAQVIAAFQAGDKTALQEANESYCPF